MAAGEQAPLVLAAPQPVAHFPPPLRDVGDCQTALTQLVEIIVVMSPTTSSGGSSVLSSRNSSALTDTNSRVNRQVCEIDGPLLCP